MEKLLIKIKFLFFILAILTLIVSLDNNHYWHDIRFSYAASKFPMNKILSGAFNPHQFGGKIDETSASGFYLSKVLHILILQKIYQWIPPNEGGFYLSTWLSVLFFIITFLISYRFYIRIFSNKTQAWFALYCILFMPITGYLSGKLLSETLAVMFMSISLFFFITAFELRKNLIVQPVIGSTIFLLLSALARLDIVLCFLGFFTASLFYADTKIKRIEILKSGFLSALIFLVAYFGIFYFISGKNDALIQYFKSFVELEVKSNLMSIMGILTFGGVIYLVSIISFFHHEKRKICFFIIWFCTAAGFEILITSNYMVEPRYLAVGIIPLAGLGGLGLDFLWQKIKPHKYKNAIVTMAIIFAISLNIFTMQIMPYEVNKASILKAVDEIGAKENASILIPWFYTDYNFIRMMRPELAIYNVNSPRRNGTFFKLSEKWKQRLDYWNKNSYIDSVENLTQLIENTQVYYLGWRKYPPVENTIKILKHLGLDRLAEFIDQIPMTNHLAESWVWNSDRFNLEFAGRYSQYKIYKVTLSHHK
jgi:hypothetical protein